MAIPSWRPARTRGAHRAASIPLTGAMIAAAFWPEPRRRGRGVGRLSGGEPHLLIGHVNGVDQVMISPDGRWIASTGQDNTLRLWPMPDLDKPPLHTLPHDELVAKLKSLTNLRAVRDAKSSTGWSIELGPFPGWRSIPSW